MTIPKKIHYCWFGGTELPELAVRCMDSWKKYCPDYEIIRWDESNSDLESCQFVREAYAAQKWAFVSDYIRLKVVEEFGGIYLDIDVELLKPLDPFLECQGFMGFEQQQPYCIATGLGFGAIAQHPVIQKLMANYENSPFVKADGGYDLIPCPSRDTNILVKLGLQQLNFKQNVMGIEFFPTTFFCPISLFGVKNFSDETVSIHHYNASWASDASLTLIQKKRGAVAKFGNVIGMLLGFIYTLSYSYEERGVVGTVKKILHYIRSLY